MNIIGINCGLHDSSACLVINGKLASFSSEERFTRKKHDGAYPFMAIDFCLSQAGLSYDQIDAVAYGWNYMPYEGDKLLYHIKKSLELAKGSPEKSIEYLKDLLARKERMYATYGDARLQSKKLFKCDFIEVGHHISHAYSAFPVSGFDSAAVLVVDGSGEKMATSLWHYRNGCLSFIKSYDIPHSLGIYYGAITQYLGFVHHDEEWKVMGWAPYGKNTYYEKLKQLVSMQDMSLDLKYFQHQNGGFPWYSAELIRLLATPPRKKEDGFESIYADIAASAQHVLEDCILKLAKEIKDITKESNLVMCGGVALNGKANGHVLDAKIFEKIFVQPASADDGVSIGAALKVSQERGQDIFNKLKDVYLGVSFKKEDIQKAFDAKKLKYTRLDDKDLMRFVAKKISEQNVVGWMQGRAEMGPRALGNRSILGDPRSDKMKDLINSKIKFREPFRPFAPSVLEEHASEYFSGNISNAWFMNQIFNVRPEKKESIPAVTHIDGTARIQVVTRNLNPRYYNLIKEFQSLTAVPILINTSFNVKGEPIVNSPEDAINCFLNTGIDILVIENYIAEK